MRPFKETSLTCRPLIREVTKNIAILQSFIYLCGEWNGFFRPSGRCSRPKSDKMRNFLLTLALIAGSAIAMCASVVSRPVMSNPVLSASGSPDIPVVLVEFADLGFSLEDPAAFYEELFNGTEISLSSSSGSVRQWFDDNSRGVFTPRFHILGPVTLPLGYIHYGENDPYGGDMHILQMIQEACSLALDAIDPAPFDSDGDGMIDIIQILYAGMDDSGTGFRQYVQPRVGSVIEEGGWAQAEGYVIDHFILSNELESIWQHSIGRTLRSYCSLLGLPSLTDPDAGNMIQTPGHWSLMDLGWVNRNGDTPAALSAPERFALGWIDPPILPQEDTVNIYPLAEGGDAWLMPTDSEDEYFLLEYRALQGWDAGLPGEGVLVWHICFDRNLWDEDRVNSDSSHQGVRLIKANKTDLYDSTSADVNHTASGWAFPGRNDSMSLSALTSPPLLTSDGSPTLYSLNDIHLEEGYASLRTGVSDEYPAPVALSPSSDEVGETWFTASWLPSSGNEEGYLVSLYHKSSDPASEDYCDFGYGESFIIPYGWYASSTAIASLESMCGATPPALRLNNDSDYLLSPDYGSPVNFLSFFLLGINGGSYGTIFLSGTDGKGSNHLIDIIPVPDTATVYTYDTTRIPDDIRQIRLMFNRMIGAVIIDDVRIAYGSADTFIRDVQVSGDDTRVDMTALPDDGATYSFRVQACYPPSDDDERDVILSAPSNSVTVTLNRPDLLRETPLPLPWRLENRRILSSSPLRIVTLSGSCVGYGTDILLPCAGLYVIITDSGATKLAVD